MLLPEQMGRLNDILQKKFSYTLADEFDRETAIIDKIIKRGIIRNDREFDIGNVPSRIIQLDCIFQISATDIE